MTSPPLDVDLEKGDKSIVATQRGSSATAYTAAAGSQAHPLDVFQTLVGIEHLAVGGGPTKDPKQKVPKHRFRNLIFPAKTNSNKGLYSRALSNDWQNRFLYAASNYIISGLYLFQILLAAIFTALSAYQGTSSVSLTVLGAINTVVAGILAWLKGQGMPNRFRQARDQYREVVRAIEMSERMFAEIDYLEGPKPDPIRERDRLEKLFGDARMDQMANYPDTHVSMSTRQSEGEMKDLKELLGKKDGEAAEQRKLAHELLTKVEDMKSQVAPNAKTA